MNLLYLVELGVRLSQTHHLRVELEAVLRPKKPSRKVPVEILEPVPVDHSLDLAEYYFNISKIPELDTVIF